MLALQCSCVCLFLLFLVRFNMCRTCDGVCLSFLSFGYVLCCLCLVVLIGLMCLYLMLRGVVCFCLTLVAFDGDCLGLLWCVLWAVLS